MKVKFLQIVIFVMVAALILAGGVLFSGCKSAAETAGDTEVQESDAEEPAVEEVDVKEAPEEIAVLLPGSVEFFSVEQKGFDAAATDYGVKLTYADAEWDAGKQLSQVENFVAKGVDCIMLCAADNEALIPAVKTCNDADIPLLVTTNPVGPDPTGVYEGIESFIGFNEVEVGRLLGEMAEQLLGDEDGKIVMIEGNPGTPPQRNRREGFLEIVEMHDNWEVVYSQPIEGWTKEGSLAMMEDFIQTNTEFNLVSTQWVTAAVAAATAIDEAGITDDIKIVGVEFTKEAVPFMKEGKIDMLSYYSIEELGYVSIETAVKFLNGEKVPAFVESVKHEIVTVDNVDNFEPEL